MIIDERQTILIPRSEHVFQLYDTETRCLRDAVDAHYIIYLMPENEIEKTLH